MRTCVTSATSWTLSLPRPTRSSLRNCYEVVLSHPQAWSTAYHAVCTAFAYQLRSHPITSAALPLLLALIKAFPDTLDEQYTHERELSATLPSLAIFTAAVTACNTAVDKLKARCVSELGVSCPSELLAHMYHGGNEADAPLDFARWPYVGQQRLGWDFEPCACCGVIIQNGTYGLGTPRRHCLQCYSTAICTTCSDVLDRCWAELTDPASRELLLQCNPHLAHECVTEHDEQTSMRLKLSSKTIQQSYAAAFQVYAHRPCFGRISGNTVVYSTYAQELRRIQRIAASLASLSRSLDRVAISFSGSRLWYDIEMSIAWRRCVSTGIPHSWAAREWLAVAQRAAITVAFVDSRVLTSICGDDLGKLAALVPTLRCVVLVDDDAHQLESFDRCIAPAAATSTSAQQINLVSFRSFIEASHGADLETTLVPGEPSDAAVILYSSGSTGTPKGLIVSNQASMSDYDHADMYKPYVQLSYLPPCWATDKWIVWATVLNGGRVGFADTDLVSIFDSLRIVAPVSVIMLPAVGQALRSEFQAFYDKTMQTAKSGVVPFSAAHRASAKAQAIEHLTSCLGPRCANLTLGGAKVSPALLQLLRDYLPILVSDSYGTSESAGIMVDGRVNSKVRVKLLDRPDLGYTNADKPLPRGEICVKTKEQAPVDGWLCSEQEMVNVRERYLDDGFFRTVCAC